ncbi:dual specificity protein kinase shkD-like [Rhagoletis pomonella]|uniref:dual specificity protein kinase shkD-like n=1 Tax=Rhagoletis pomonella TaxID=28610 RepID=UPI00177C9C1A|nr:dual specificity protein kinase shkD-like [Rhagoletis pomonella]
MQTGSSGCQFSWLTIFLLVALVLCYQQQNLAMQATSAVVGVAISTKATEMATKSPVLPVAQAAPTNGSELRQNDIKATIATTTTNSPTTEAETAIDNLLLHGKLAINNTIALTTTISAVPNKTMAGKAITTTTSAQKATDAYVAYELRPMQKMLPGGTQRSKCMTAATTTTTTTLTNVATTIATSSRAASAISPIKAALATTISRNKTTKTTTKKCSSTTNMPTSSTIASSHNPANISHFKVQLTQSSYSRGNISRPTSAKRKINCNEMSRSSSSNNNKNMSNSKRNNNSSSSSSGSTVGVRILTPAKDTNRCNEDEVANRSCQTACHHNKRVAAVR